MNKDTIKKFCDFTNENYGTELVQDPDSEYTTEELVTAVVTGIFDYHASRLGEQLRSTKKMGGSEEATATFKNEYISMTASVRENEDEGNAAVSVEAMKGLIED